MWSYWKHFGTSWKVTTSCVASDENSIHFSDVTIPLEGIGRINFWMFTQNHKFLSQQNPCKSPDTHEDFIKFCWVNIAKFTRGRSDQDSEIEEVYTRSRSKQTRKCKHYNYCQQTIRDVKHITLYQVVWKKTNDKKEGYLSKINSFSLERIAMSKMIT